MPYLVMQGDLYLACSKPFRLSKKLKAAKNWNNDELAKKAIKMIKEQGIDINGMVVKSTRAANKEAKEKVVETQPHVIVSNTSKKRGRPPKVKVIEETVENIEPLLLDIITSTPNEEPEDEVKVIPVFDVVKVDKSSSMSDIVSAFSGVNVKCVSCAKDCKQDFKEKIVFCPLYKESAKHV